MKIRMYPEDGHVRWHAMYGRLGVTGISANRRSAWASIRLRYGPVWGLV